MRKDVQEKVEMHQDLTNESIMALEKQCNKLCLRKLIKAFTF